MNEKNEINEKKSERKTAIIKSKKVQFGTFSNSVF